MQNFSIVDKSLCRAEVVSNFFFFNEERERVSLGKENIKHGTRFIACLLTTYSSLESTFLGHNFNPNVNLHGGGDEEKGKKSVLNTVSKREPRCVNVFLVWHFD